jgi:hypothetical protein
LSLLLIRVPFDAVTSPVGTVKRMNTESALSAGASLHGHHVRAP